MVRKTVLLIDDELGFIEALEDALVYEGHAVLKASSAEDALQILRTAHVDLVTVDIMLPQGKSLESKVDSHRTGLMLCDTIRRSYPKIDVFCISVVTDIETIRIVEKLGVRFLRKGETPLRTVLDMIRSRLTGVAYSSDRLPHDRPR
ncbi:MAG: response regulator [Chloroflexi bacterium]|nr:response regulator [Chloroflexota bacterium]